MGYPSNDAGQADHIGSAKAPQDAPGYQPTAQDWDRLFQSIEEKSRVARFYVNRVLEKQAKNKS